MRKFFFQKNSVFPERWCFPFSESSETNWHDSPLFPHLFASIICEQPLKDFKLLSGSKVMVIVLECDGVASGRVCYQQGHLFSIPMCVKVFLVLCWDQSDTMNSLKNIVNFLFIGISNQKNNLWKNMWTQFQKCSDFMVFYRSGVAVAVL